MTSNNERRYPSERKNKRENTRDFGLVGKGGGFIPTGDANAMPEGREQGKRGSQGSCYGRLFRSSCLQHFSAAASYGGHSSAQFR